MSPFKKMQQINLYMHIHTDYYVETHKLSI